jgi:hypothetical protein
MSLEEKYQHLCATPSDINDALPVLREFASRCKHVTEFGIRTAVSTTALLAAQPDRLISYDIELNMQFLRDLDRVKGRTNFSYRLGDTRHIQIEPTNMLFIDTCHQYQQLKTELERHAGMVSTYLAFHDTWGYRFTDEGDSPTFKKGLWPAIDEFLNGEAWENVYEIRDRWGLTVLKRKMKHL